MREETKAQEIFSSEPADEILSDEECEEIMREVQISYIASIREDGTLRMSRVDSVGIVTPMTDEETAAYIDLLEADDDD